MNKQQQNHCLRWNKVGPEPSSTSLLFFSSVSKGCDDTLRMWRLIWAFAARIGDNTKLLNFFGVGCHFWWDLGFEYDATFWQKIKGFCSSLWIQRLTIVLWEDSYYSQYKVYHYRYSTISVHARIQKVFFRGGPTFFCFLVTEWI